jgi:hypothetical protein
LIVSADDVGVTVHVDGALPTDVVVPYHIIDRARTVFEWGPTPKQSGKGTRRRTQSTSDSSVGSRTTEVTAS